MRSASGIDAAALALVVAALATGAAPTAALQSSITEGQVRAGLGLLPVEAGTLGLPRQDPGDGRPYLHHGGTANAHIMWSRSGPTR